MESREKAVEEQFKALRRAAEDPLLRILEEQKERLRSIYDSAWMSAMEKEVNEGDSGQETSEERSSDEEKVDIEWSVTREEVEALEGEKGVETGEGSVAGGVGQEEKLMGVLGRVQEEAKCEYDVEALVRPYVQDCIRRKEKGEPFRVYSEFVRANLVCVRCYHYSPDQKKNHLEPACKVLCCNIKRCELCLHEHVGESCECTHSKNFFQLLKEELAS